MFSVSSEESYSLDSYMDGLIDLDLFDFEDPDGSAPASGEEREGGENKLKEQTTSPFTTISSFIFYF